MLVGQICCHGRRSSRRVPKCSVYRSSDHNADDSLTAGGIRRSCSRTTTETASGSSNRSVAIQRDEGVGEVQDWKECRLGSPGIEFCLGSRNRSVYDPADRPENELDGGQNWNTG